MRRTPPGDRVLATVMFTDIVGSTELASELGDRRWRDLVARHHAVVRRMLKRHRGREIDTAGDGFFATFDRPAQAIGCAIEIIEGLRPLGVTIRAGIHAGELELTGGQVRGIAVHTGARVMGAAGPGEILVTATVRELVAGSEIAFADRGAHTLKGVDGEWRLFSVVQPVAAVEPEETGAGAEERGARTRARLSRAWAVIGLIAVLVLAVVAAAVVVPRILSGPIVPGANTVGHIPAGGRTFDAAIAVGAGPTAVAAGENSVWVINYDAKTLSRIDPARRLAVANQAVGGTPTGVAAGGGAVWVTAGFGLASGQPGVVVRFSPGTNQGAGQIQDEGQIAVGSGAGSIAYGEGAVWVVDQVRELVLKIDPATNRVEQEVPVGRGPGGVAVGGGSVWVTSTLDRAVWRINPATYEVEQQIPLLDTPSAIAATDSQVWVTSETGDLVQRIDPLVNQVSTTIPSVGDGPRGVAPVGESAWVALGGEHVVVLLDRAGTETARLAVDGAPEGIVVDTAGDVWVTVR